MIPARSSTPESDLGSPSAAPLVQRVAAQARLEIGLILGNGEQLLVAIVLPVLLLVALRSVSVPDLGAGRRIDVLTPGVLALAVISTSFTGQAIATGFDRRYGVLRLLGTTPLGRSGLVAGKVLAVLVIQALQMVVVGAIALALGWQPRVLGVLPALLAVTLGTAAFVSLALLLAGTLRAEATLAAANLVWVLLVAGGGVLVPVTQLPGSLARVASALPSGALGEAMRVALVDGQVAWGPCAVLALWTLAAGAAAARWFRWD